MLRHFALVLLVAACGGGSSSSGTAPSANGTTTSPADPASPAAPAPAAPGDPTAPTDPPPVPYQHFDINHVVSTGQSNSVALESIPVLSTSQPYANLMFDAGVMPMSQCDSVGCKQYSTPTSFVPLVEGDGFFDYPVETMSAGLANEVSRISPDPAHAVLVSLHGRSGNTYWCLRKGSCSYHSAEYTKPFQKSIQAVSDAAALAKTQGKSYVVRAVTAIHGESDHYNEASGHSEFPLKSSDGQSMLADYGHALEEWQHDYEHDIRAITNQVVPVPLLISQMDNFTEAHTSSLMIQQYEAHVRSKGKVVLVTPGYPLSFASDCLHFSNEGERRLGEYFAKAYARIVFDGRAWQPVHPKSVSLAGNVVTAIFHVPKPPLVLDTTLVTNPGSYGFEWTDDSGAPPAIADVAVIAPDTVKITLASAPTGGNKKLRYAYTGTGACPGPTTGARGNLRDSDATPSQSGSSLFNWAAHFEVAVP